MCLRIDRWADQSQLVLLWIHVLGVHGAGGIERRLFSLPMGLCYLQAMLVLGEYLLDIASPSNAVAAVLSPAQVFIAEPLPANWRAPAKLWQTLHAILCWQIWKNCNEHFLAGMRSDSHRVIYKSWHCFGIYIWLDWQSKVKRIRFGKLRYGEAETSMQAQFGSNPAIWSLHEMILQVPPVPP